MALTGWRGIFPWYARPRSSQNLVSRSPGKKVGRSLRNPLTSSAAAGNQATSRFAISTHFVNEFDGTETTDPRPTAERQVTFQGATNIVVRRDHSFCMEAGFCGNRLTDIEKMVALTGDTQVRAQVIAMAERCPSGSYTYAIQAGGPDIEPDLPQQIAITVEITSDGPIEGPLWVTGNIPIELSDGQLLETRNRVTLCNCGASKNKPLCDGTHRTLPERKIKGR